MNDPFVTIDLHGLMRDDAKKRIDRALRDAGPNTFLDGAGVSTESGIPDFRSKDDNIGKGLKEANGQL